MTMELLHRLDRLAYALAPAFVIALLMLASLIPLRLPFLPSVATLLPLMAVFHFSLHRPAAVPAPALLLFGLLFDLMQYGPGAPLGVSALQFLLVWRVVSSSRKYLLEVSFAFIWLLYALVVGAAVTLAWLLGALLLVSFVDPWPALLQYVVSLFLYPILGWLLGRNRLVEAPS
jgi:rod shape-determining protein MreD